MHNVKPFAFIIGYLLVALAVIAFEPLRDIVFLVAKVLAAVAFLAMVACIIMESLQDKKHE